MGLYKNQPNPRASGLFTPSPLLLTAAAAGGAAIAQQRSSSSASAAGSQRKSDGSGVASGSARDRERERCRGLLRTPSGGDSTDVHICEYLPRA